MLYTENWNKNKTRYWLFFFKRRIFVIRIMNKSYFTFLFIGIIVLLLSYALIKDWDWIYETKSMKSNPDSKSPPISKKVRFSDAIGIYVDPTQTKLDRKNPNYRLDLIKNIKLASQVGGGRNLAKLTLQFSQDQDPEPQYTQTIEPDLSSSQSQSFFGFGDNTILHPNLDWRN